MRLKTIKVSQFCCKFIAIGLANHSGSLEDKLPNQLQCYKLSELYSRSAKMSTSWSVETNIPITLTTIIYEGNQLACRFKSWACSLNMKMTLRQFSISIRIVQCKYLISLLLMLAWNLISTAILACNWFAVLHPTKGYFTRLMRSFF